MNNEEILSIVHLNAALSVAVNYIVDDPDVMSAVVRVRIGAANTVPNGNPGLISISGWCCHSETIDDDMVRALCRAIDTPDLKDITASINDALGSSLCNEKQSIR